MFQKYDTLTSETECASYNPKRFTARCSHCIDYYKESCLCSYEVDNLKEIRKRKCFKPKISKR